MDGNTTVAFSAGGVSLMGMSGLAMGGGPQPPGLYESPATGVRASTPDVAVRVATQFEGRGLEGGSGFDPRAIDRVLPRAHDTVEAALRDVPRGRAGVAIKVDHLYVPATLGPRNTSAINRAYAKDPHTLLAEPRATGWSSWPSDEPWDITDLWRGHPQTRGATGYAPAAPLTEVHPIDEAIAGVVQPYGTRLELRKSFEAATAERRAALLPEALSNRRMSQAGVVAGAVVTAASVGAYLVSKYHHGTD